MKPRYKRHLYKSDEAMIDTLTSAKKHFEQACRGIDYLCDYANAINIGLNDWMVVSIIDTILTDTNEALDWLEYMREDITGEEDEHGE